MFNEQLKDFYLNRMRKSNQSIETLIGETTSRWLTKCGEIHKEFPLNNYHMAFLKEVVRILHINNYVLSNRNLAEFIDPKFYEININNFLKLSKSEILFYFIKSDLKKRTENIIEIRAFLLNKKYPDINNYLTD